VSSFLERVQGKPGQKRPNSGGIGIGISISTISIAGPAGWLELKKGFSVDLGTDGRLTVLRDGVLQSVEGGDTIPISSIREGSPLVRKFGCWTVKLGWWDETCGDEEEKQASLIQKVLQSPRDILPGYFRYSLSVSESSGSGSSSSSSGSGSSSSSNSSSSGYLQLMCDRPGRKAAKEGGGKPPAPLAGVDIRIRSGIPLFVAVDADAGVGSDEGEGDAEEVVRGGSGDGVLEKRVLCLQYKYQPQSAA